MIFCRCLSPKPTNARKAVVLAKYLEHTHNFELSGKVVVELGSGTGVVGIAASMLGAGKVLIIVAILKFAPLIIDKR